MKVIKDYIDSHGQIVTKEITVYRGQTVNDTIDPTWRDFFSTSADKEIAKDFAGRDGYLFTIHLQPGVKYIKIDSDKNNSKYSYEAEYLVRSGGYFKKRADGSLDYWPSVAAAAAAAAAKPAPTPTPKKGISRSEIITKRIRPNYEELGIPLVEEELTNEEIRAYLGPHENLQGGRRKLKKTHRRKNTKKIYSRKRRAL